MAFVRNVSIKINVRHVSRINTISTPQAVCVKPALNHYRGVDHAQMDKPVRFVRIPITYKSENV
jgi:hypothetical protein